MYILSGNEQSRQPILASLMSEIGQCKLDNIKDEMQNIVWNTQSRDRLVNALHVRTRSRILNSNMGTLLHRTYVLLYIYTSKHRILPVRFALPTNWRATCIHICTNLQLNQQITNSRENCNQFSRKCIEIEQNEMLSTARITLARITLHAGQTWMLTS